MRIDDVRRITLGTFVRPPEETGGAPRVEGVYGYLVRHDDGLVLLDTGIGEGDAETEAWYRPRRVPLPDALATVGIDLDDLTLVANCHFHFDHCGGNPIVGRTPAGGGRRSRWPADRRQEQRGPRPLGRRRRPPLGGLDRRRRGPTSPRPSRGRDLGGVDRRE